MKYELATSGVAGRNPRPQVMITEIDVPLSGKLKIPKQIDKKTAVRASDLFHPVNDQQL